MAISVNFRTLSQLSIKEMNLFAWCVPANAVLTAFTVFLSILCHFSAIVSSIVSEPSNWLFASLIDIPILFKTFSTSLNASPVSASTNFPALIWFILDKIVFNATPIVESVSCVTSFIVASIATVFSKLIEALLACEATFVNASPIPPASLALARSTADKTSFTWDASLAAILKPLIVAVRISADSSASIFATLLRTILSWINWLVSCMVLPCLKKASALSPTAFVVAPSSCARSL